jgi:hypothetical protein
MFLSIAVKRRIHIPGTLVAEAAEAQSQKTRLNAGPSAVQSERPDTARPLTHLKLHAAWASSASTKQTFIFMHPWL